MISFPFGHLNSQSKIHVICYILFFQQVVNYSVPGSVLMIEVIIKAVKMMFPKKWIGEVVKKFEDRTF